MLPSPRRWSNRRLVKPEVGVAQVLDRTFSILELFNEEQPAWTATEIARALDLPVPTAYRLLAALRGLEYVHQDPETKRFRLGLVDLRLVALPVLQLIARESGETSLLTVPSATHDASVCLERVETPQPLRLSLQPGRQLPLHAGASQKALLAFMREEEIERVLSRPLERLCSATITDKGALLRELAHIRRRGWASSYEETNLGVWGVAVPIVDARGVIAAAVGIAGPSARLSSARVADHVRRIHSGARTIAGALGLDVPAVKELRARVDGGKKGGRR
jgi:DNA-binding IclR family transcriptional regulator